MIYQATILRFRYVDDFEGIVSLSVGEQTLFARHFTPLKFLRENLRENDVRPLDFRVTGGIAVPSGDAVKEIPVGSLSRTGGFGVFRGSVASVDGPRDCKLDCGDMTFDVREDEEAARKAGDFISMDGILQVFFPDTDYSWEAFLARPAPDLPTWRL